jgi:hypothetical protein
MSVSRSSSSISAFSLLSSIPTASSAPLELQHKDKLYLRIDHPRRYDGHDAEEEPERYFGMDEEEIEVDSPPPPTSILIWVQKSTVMAP